jgi:hypothetical protein
VPTARVLVSPSTTATHIEVWFCTVCGRDAVLKDTGGSAIAAIEYFIDALGWRQLPAGEVVCDRCKLQPEIAHILLATGGARTQ